MLDFFSRKDLASAAAPADPPTPGPTMPGGPSPDVPLDVSVKHIPPSPVSSHPPLQQPSPRFVEHIGRGVSGEDAATSAAALPASPATVTQIPTPPPDTPLPVTAPGGLTEAEVPSQHPAIGSPIEVVQGKQVIAMPEPDPAPTPSTKAALETTHADPVSVSAFAPADNEPKTVRLANPALSQQSPKTIMRNASVRSKHTRSPSSPRATSPTATGSLRTTATTGSTFANGAATAAPYVGSQVVDALHERRATADDELTAQDRAKISKDELKHNRRLSRIIRKEAQAENKALDVATRELADIQKLQKTVIKDEGTAHAAHTRALAAEHKAELAFIAARQVHEKAQAELRSAEAALNASRTHARETTEMLREKAEEVEALRLQKGTDDRERAVRVRELVGDEKRGVGRFFGL